MASAGTSSPHPDRRPAAPGLDARAAGQCPRGRPDRGRDRSRPAGRHACSDLAAADGRGRDRRRCPPPGVGRGRRRASRPGTGGRRRRPADPRPGRRPGRSSAPPSWRRVATANGRARRRDPGLGLAETVKRVVDGRIVETLDRSVLGTAQTPQGIRRDLLERGFNAAFLLLAGPTFTDEAALLEACRIPVHVVAGDPMNLKVTVAEDLERAEAALVGHPGRYDCPGPGGLRHRRNRLSWNAAPPCAGFWSMARRACTATRTATSPCTPLPTPCSVRLRPRRPSAGSSLPRRTTPAGVASSGPAGRGRRPGPAADARAGIDRRDDRGLPGPAWPACST